MNYIEAEKKNEDTGESSKSSKTSKATRTKRKGEASRLKQ
jgi:hypothetical protein